MGSDCSIGPRARGPSARETLLSRRAGPRYSARTLDIAPEALAAFGRPEFGELVECRECRDAVRQLDPRQFAADEDVDVGRDRVGLVERPGAQQHGVARRGAVFAVARGAPL